MVKIEEIDEPKSEPQVERKRKMYKRYHGSAKFFLFVDYFFLFVFFGFLPYIILKILDL